MGDFRCGWCDAPLPEHATAARRYCSQAHRQAAWRARRRWEAAAQARQALVLAGMELLSRTEQAARQAGERSPTRQASTGCHSAAVADICGLADQLMRRAVLADRMAGASWTSIGEGLGISGGAARHRFGHGESGAQEWQARPESDGTSPALLEPLLLPAVRESGASTIGLYLLPPGHRALRLVVLTGVKTAALWERVAPTAPNPVADSVREHRLVWIRSHAELAHRYPKIALALPYPLTVAAAPLTTGVTTWGGLIFLWPGSHPPVLGPHERGVIATTCDRTAALLQHAAATGHPVVPRGRPHLLAPPRTRVRGPHEALAAADLVDRLAEGCLALDAEGRITFISAAACELFGQGARDMLGTPVWEALPWLDEPVFQDHYRAAAISRRPVSFLALRPPDQQLEFQLHPDVTGTSVRVMAAEGAGPADHPPPGSAMGAPAPTRSRALYDLMHLAATLTEAVSVQDVVELAADQILPAFDAQGFVLSVAEDGRLRIVGSRGYRREVLSPLDGPPLTDQSAPTVHALTHGTPLFFASVQEMERFSPVIPPLTKRSAWAFLPLTASGRPVGCWVLSFDRPHAFTPDERAVLTSLAGLIAQALDRARLYDAKHQLAHDLQTGLLPAALPAVPGLRVAARYLPAARGMDVGGDFYDLIRCGGGSVAAAIGDVQGHNVNAAALMGQVRTAVHATAGAPPSEVLSRANRLLTDFDPGLFASCLYVHLDLEQHYALLATAGHPPPLLRHPDGHTEVLDLPCGLLLGIDPAADYEATRIPLPPDAVLALYTDGLIETPGVDLDDATAVLADRLSRGRHKSVDALADDLVRHAPHTDPRSDDIALLLLHPQSAAA